MIAAGFFLLGVVVGIAFLAVRLAWDGANPAPPMETIDPDAEARATAYEANRAARWQG